MEQFSFITSLGLRPTPTPTLNSHIKTPRRTATKSESDTFGFKNQPRTRFRFRSPHPKTPDSEPESLVFFPGFRSSSTTTDKKKKKEAAGRAGARAGAGGSTPKQNRRKRSQNGRQTSTPVKLSYKEMIVKSMESLDIEKGSPMHSIQAIKSWMITKYDVVTNQKAFNNFFGKALLVALEEGRVIRMTGQGLTGSFRLNRISENGKTPTTPKPAPAPAPTPTRPMSMPMPTKAKSKPSGETPTAITTGTRVSTATTPASRKPKTSTVTSATSGSGMELRSSRKTVTGARTGTGAGSVFTPNTIRSNQRVQRWLDNNMEDSVSADSAHSTPDKNHSSPTSPAADANNFNVAAGFEFETITLDSSDSDSDSDSDDDDDDGLQNEIYEMDMQKLARTLNPNKENVNQVSNSNNFGEVGVGGHSSNYGEGRRQPAVEDTNNQNNQLPLMDFSANYKNACWDESMYLREWELEHIVENNNPRHQIMGSLNMVGASAGAGAGSSNYGQGEASGASGSSGFAQPSLFASISKGASGANDQVRMANLAGRINGIAISPAASSPFKRQVTKRTIDEDEYDF